MRRSASRRPHRALFREFAFTLAGAVIISGLVAVTLSPMMSARFCKPHGVAKPFPGSSTAFEAARALAMRGAVGGSLDYRALTLVDRRRDSRHARLHVHPHQVGAGAGRGPGRSSAHVTGPRYATSDYTEAYVDQFRDWRRTIPESTADSRSSASAAANGAFAWRFKPWSSARAELRDQAGDPDGLSKCRASRRFVFAPPSLPGAGGGLPVRYVIRSLGDPSRSTRSPSRSRSKAMETGKFVVVQNSLAFDLPRAR